MEKTFLIYGAYGYTGELITRFAVERGMKPILAGRNAIAVEELAKKHHLEYRVFSLDETDRLDAALQEVEMVLHCAGPFSLTSRGSSFRLVKKDCHSASTDFGSAS